MEQRETTLLNSLRLQIKYFFLRLPSLNEGISRPRAAVFTRSDRSPDTRSATRCITYQLIAEPNVNEIRTRALNSAAKHIPTDSSPSV